MEELRTPATQRPSLEAIYMRLAGMLAQRSTCSRLQVGAVVASPDMREIFAVGYNGGPVGGFNDCLSEEPGRCGHAHAEDNACNFAPARVPKIMLVTHFPCPACCVRIVNKLGFERVYYQQVYRDMAGLDILESAGITVAQLDPSLD
ncbi:Cytidine and deoxycytidylate deaminase zinc-binding region [compost metagenome]